LHAACTAVKPEDAALIVYTSGSTGSPKGALLSHRAIVRTCREQCAHWWAEPFRILGNLPINHVGMAVQGSCQALVAGGTLVFMERFQPDRMPDVIARDNVTIIHQVATMYQIMLDRDGFDPDKLRSLQKIIWSGAPAPLDLIARLREITPHLHTSYGSTEVGGEVLFTVEGADDETLATTVGYPPDEYRVRLADEAGTPVADGDSGEIQVRSDTVMNGYFDRTGDTEAAFTPDGWLRTGDVGQRRPQGDYRIVGRIKEMFKSGGYNIYPREIELAIEAHPGVAAAAVIAVPDPVFVEVGRAYLLAEKGIVLDPHEIERHCRERLSNYKVPKSFEIRTELPMLPIGKIDKKALQREASGP
jgi:acyl-CoA synthetase (AMP-forming)/AMP-acid ligase II